MAGILQLPDHGRLIVCTDLQGCLRDFEQIVTVFLRALEDSAGDAHILFTGDLVHGPHIDRKDWPEFLGEFYRDESGDLMKQFSRLRTRYAGRVHGIIGNHEHGHIGGPHTAKFAIDEVELLETRMGPDASAWLRNILRELPLVAVAPCGAVFTHGAPAAEITSRAEVEAASLDGLDRSTARSTSSTSRWSGRSCGRARRRPRWRGASCAPWAAPSRSTDTTSSPRASSASATSRSWSPPASACSTQQGLSRSRPGGDLPDGA